METAPTFGQWVKRRRHELGLTQEEVANATGYSPETIRKIEAGKRRPSHQVAEHLADLLQVDPQERQAFVLWARGLGVSDSRLETTEDVPPAANGSVSSVIGRPSSLPVLPMPLIGRERELGHLKALLWRSSTRLLTLLGPPGIGKTSLCIALATALQADFKDGLLYVPLAPVSEPALVPATLAEGLGVRETAARPLLESMQDVLCDKQMLLVLDNFEQVVSAAPLLADLLAASPQLKALVTSRSALHLRGEKLVEVPPLDVPDPEHLPSIAELERIGSVALFMERARDVNSDFALTAENAPLVAAICARVDGLPLAIELAAARTRLLSLSGLLSRLEHQFTVLTGGPRDAPLHHRTLRDSLESSYKLLRADEQQLFRRLGIFAGPFTFEAAEQVAEATLEGIEAILDQSLVRLQSRSTPERELASRNGDFEARFAMLVPVREYAIDQLEVAGELNEVAFKHALYFLDVALAAQVETTGPNQKLALERIGAAYSDIRTALDWTLKNEQVEIAMRMAGAVRFFWQTRGYRQEGMRWLKLALAGGEDASAGARAEALHALGSLLYRQGDLAGADTALSEAVGLWRDVGESTGLVNTLLALGQLLADLGEYERAVHSFREALALSEKEGDKNNAAKTLSGLARVASRQGDPDQAFSLYGESLVIRRQLGVPNEIAQSLNNLGAVALKQGDYPRAIAYAEEGAAISSEMGNKEFLSFALGVAGKAALRLGDMERAASNFSKCLGLFVELDSTQMVAFVFEEFARIAIHSGRPARAARLFGTAEAQRESVGATVDPADRAERDENIASLRRALSEPEFNAAWALGRGMALDEAIAYARNGG